MEIIGIIGYLSAAAAFLIFSLLLLAAKIDTLHGRLIFVLSTLTLASSITSASQIYSGTSLKTVLIIENIKYFIVGLLLLSSHLGVFKSSMLIESKQIRKYCIAFVLISLTCWGIAYFGLGKVNYIFILFLLITITQIVFIEQLYRNSDVKMKWALWPLVIGLGTSTVFDFVIYAQASLVNQLDFSYWYARGYLVTLCMPFLLISARRMKDWSVDVFISREIVFYSSMLVIAGGYLLLLSMAGYLINLVGGRWGSVISIAFLGLGSTVLIALLLTEKLRREVKVFITKHFYANKYDYRIEWLRSIEQLQVNAGEDAYKAATEIICASMQANKAALVKKESTRQFRCLFEKDFNFDTRTSIFLEKVEQFYKKNAWIIDVREYNYVENSYPELELDVEYCREASIDLIVPILNGEELYGVFLLSLSEGRGILNWEDRDLLFALTKQLSNYLSLNDANTALSESKQFEAFHRMSAFLVHDLKNIQAQLDLINSNAKRHRNNPAFIDDVFETIESASTRLDKVLTQLRNKQVAETPAGEISVNDVIENVVKQRNVNKPSVEQEIDGELTLVTEKQEFMSVLNHLIQNAQEATPSDGWVKVRASQDGPLLRIAILDNGSGMSEEFIKKRLFKPFDTTKGNAGMGIGVYEAKQFIEAQGGELQVTSFVNEGSIFQITLPHGNK